MSDKTTLLLHLLIKDTRLTDGSVAELDSLNREIFAQLLESVIRLLSGGQESQRAKVAFDSQA